MSARRAVLFVMREQRRRAFDSARDAVPVPARIPTGAGRPRSVRGMRTGMW
jgi:hypothetical protein